MTTLLKNVPEGMTKEHNKKFVGEYSELKVIQYMLKNCIIDDCNEFDLTTTAEEALDHFFESEPEQHIVDRFFELSFRAYEIWEYKGIK